MKILHCRDAGFDCDAVFRGDDTSQILAQVNPHAAEAHNLQVTTEIEDQLGRLVRDA